MDQLKSNERDRNGGHRLGDEYRPKLQNDSPGSLVATICDFSDPFEERKGKKIIQVERLKAVSDLEMEVTAWDLEARGRK